MMTQESPAKRPRLDGRKDTDPCDLVQSMNQAVTTSQRFDVFQRLFTILHYNIKTRACYCDPRLIKFLVDAGVISALYLQLGFVVNRHGSSQEEVAFICTALDIFYRFCPELNSEKLLKAAIPGFFKHLLDAMERDVVLPVLSILHSCSSSECGTSLLLQDLSILHSIFGTFQRQTYGNHEIMELLGLMKNLTYYDESSRQRIIEFNGLLELLTSLVEYGLDEKADERLSAVIRNLALSPKTRVQLAQRSEVLTCLARLANKVQRNTLRNILNTFVSLTMDADSCLLIVFHGDGMLLELMKRYAAFENDSVVRKRATRALRLLARDSLVHLMVHDKELMGTLSYRALHDTDSEVRTEAAEAFARYAGLMKAAMPQHEAVLEALTHLAASPHVEPQVMARALREQTVHPENRAPLARKEKLLTALANIGVSKDSSKMAKELVCQTLLDLSHEQTNLEILATPPILLALVRNAGDGNDAHSRIRETAVQTLLNLAAVPANKMRMVRHSNLIQSLLHFIPATSSDILKKQVKSVLLQLAAEL